MDVLPVGSIRATKLVRRAQVAETDDLGEAVAEEVARARAALAPEEGRVLQAVLVRNAVPPETWEAFGRLTTETSVALTGAVYTFACSAVALMLLTVALVISQELRLTRMNLPYLLGTLLTPRRSKAKGQSCWPKRDAVPRSTSASPK